MSCENSDGKPTVKLKQSLSTRKQGKVRCNSLGSLKLNKDEINTIIGVKVNAISSPCKEIDKLQIPSSHENIESDGDANIQIPVSFENIDSEANLQNSASQSPFKPNRTVTRTPPGTPAVDLQDSAKNPAENNNKRVRSESTPEQENSFKRQRDNSNIVQDNCTKQAETITEEMIANFFTTMDRINRVMDQNKGVGENINLSGMDYQSIKEAHSEISKLFTLIVFKTGIIEKENLTLKQQNQTQMWEKPILTERTSINFKENNLEKNPEKTYAEAANESTRQWETPKTKKKHETLIRIDNVNDPKETMKTFKQHVNIKDIGKGFKSIKQTKNGALIVESYDKNQQAKLQSAIKTNDKFKYKENENTDPMFVITGIEKGFTNDEFMDELERLNNDIVEELQTSIKDKIKVVTKKQCRNPSRENWILQAPAKIAKWFLKREKIFFDLVTVYVQEHVNVAICYRCSRFDHVAKYCTEEKCCHKCGGRHFGKDCEIVFEKFKCPNCEKMKYPDLNHSARDTNCPVFKRRLDRFRNNINYEEHFL